MTIENIQGTLGEVPGKIANDSDEELLLYISDRTTNPDDARLAWEEFYRRHAGYVLYICRRTWGKVLDEESIESIHMETFTKVFLSADTYVLNDATAGEDIIRRRIRAWLGTIAKNATIDFLRNRRSTQLSHYSPDKLDQMECAPDAPVSDETKIVREVMSQVLDEQERAILQATYAHYNPDKEYQRLPNEVVTELCIHFGTTPANIRRVRKNATEKIKQALMQIGYRTN